MVCVFLCVIGICMDKELLNTPFFLTHLELLFAVIQLHIQAVRSIPVSIDDVCLAVAVEVCQSDPSAVLHGVLHTYR